MEPASKPAKEDAMRFRSLLALVALVGCGPVVDEPVDPAGEQPTHDAGYVAPLDAGQPPEVNCREVCSGLPCGRMTDVPKCGRCEAGDGCRWEGCKNSKTECYKSCWQFRDHSSRKSCFTNCDAHHSACCSHHKKYNPADECL